jgi:O-antigen/teichoic acid export membrane protein
LVIVLFYLGYIGFKQTVIFYILANISPAVILLFSLIRDKVFYIIPSHRLFQGKTVREFFSVAFYGLINSYSGVLAVNIDIIMISYLVGLSYAGIYSITFFFGTLIIIPARPLIKISSVIIAEAWKKNDLKIIRDVYQKSSLTLTLIGLLILIGIWGNIDNVFQIIRPEYLEGKYVILIIGLANIIDLLNGAGKQIIFNSQYYKQFSAYLLIYVGMIVLLNFLLIPTYGIIGAAVATLVSKFIFNVIIFLHIYIKHRIQIFNYKYLLLFVIAFCSYFLSTLIPQMSNYIIDILVRSSIITILYFVPVFLLKISPDINHYIKRYLQYLKFIK